MAVKLRNGTAALWASENPILKKGQLGFETDTLKWKLGDGVTAYNSLPYMPGSSSATTLFSLGNDGTIQHTGDVTRTSVFSYTLAAGAMGANGALRVGMSARMSSAPVGAWLVEVEFGGTVVAQWQTFDPAQPLRELVIQNQNAAAVQVCTTDTLVTDTTVNTAAGGLLEVWVTITDAGDTAKTLEIFSLTGELLK